MSVTSVVDFKFGKKHSGFGHFTQVEDSQVVMDNKGLMMQCLLYRRGKVLFAEIAKGKFVKLVVGGVTAKMDWGWHEILTPYKVSGDGVGLLIEIPE